MTTIVFDVNETLLDLNALNPHFEAIFGDKSFKNDWFKQVLQSALVATILGESQQMTFGDIGRMALDMVILRQNINVPESDRLMILNEMLNLPPHPEVPAALQKLEDAGFILAALTNSAQIAAETQLQNARLSPYFTKVMSVQSVGKFKPAQGVYDFAAKTLNDSPDDLWLVAAHDWDIAGAMHAGWNGAFVARPGMVIAPQTTPPQIIGDDLAQVAEKLIATLR